MHVVWINRYASLIGGCERYCAMTARGLSARGVKSTLLFDPLEEVSSEFLDCFDAAFPAVDWAAQLRELNPDAIYCHQIEGRDALHALAMQSCPVIRFFHDHGLLYKSQSGSWRGPDGGYGHPSIGYVSRSGFRSPRSFEQQLVAMRLIDAYVVASDYMVAQLQEHGLARHKIHCLPLFAESGPQGEGPRESNLLLYVGQLTRGKGVDVLLQACKQLATPWRLVIAGSGPQELEFQRLTDALGLRDRVQFCGYVPPDELPQLYSQATGLVLPTRLPETFGLVGVEAMRQGTPVIASDSGGIPSWLHHERNGLLAAPDDVDALASTLEMFISDPQLQLRLGTQARVDSQQLFSESTHLKRLMTLLRDLQTGTRYDRYTVSGNRQLERDLQATLDATVAVCRRVVGGDLDSVILFGGYGKGEGGVLQVDGVQRPQNNLDLMIVTHGTTPPGLKGLLDHELEGVRQQAQLGIDISVCPRSSLNNAPHNVLWYDMVGGHRVLHGDQAILRRHPAGAIRKLNPKDVQRLLINRGTLLVINQCMLQNPELSESQRLAVIRHGIKAIIGYGDALLFFLGEYHWSYQKKRLRMRRLDCVPEAFRLLYEEASSYRIQPRPERFAGRDLSDWNEELRCALGDVYLQCMAHYEGVEDLSWETLGSYWMPPLRRSERLALAFPAVCFPQAASGEAMHPIRYLNLWGAAADDNFLRSAEALGIQMETEEPV